MNWSLRRRAANRAHLMGAMVRKVGVDADEVARASGDPQLAAAARRCLQCEAATACGSWLERQVDGEATPPAFCPNGDLFARVRALAP